MESIPGLFKRLQIRAQIAERHIIHITEINQSKLSYNYRKRFLICKIIGALVVGKGTYVKSERIRENQRESERSIGYAETMAMNC
jgi:hypothetical protein